MEKYSEAFELLEKMVAIPSTEGNEHDMGELVYNYVTALGMKAHKQTVEGDRFNVIATAQIGNGAGKTVVLTWTLFPPLTAGTPTPGSSP